MFFVLLDCVVSFSQQLKQGNREIRMRIICHSVHAVIGMRGHSVIGMRIICHSLHAKLRSRIEDAHDRIRQTDETIVYVLYEF